jgi:hypothetical protein
MGVRIDHPGPGADRGALGQGYAAGVIVGHFALPLGYGANFRTKIRYTEK